MSETKTKRRERVERNIYKRTDAQGRTVYEIGFRDSTGRQRFRTVGHRLTAARAERDEVLGRKGKGGHVQPNPRLRFGEASDQWLTEQVATLRPATQEIYANAIRNHLRPRWGRRRLDSISVDDAARLVRELRAEGKSEWTISGILKAARRTFRFAERRLNWHGRNPIDGLENGERPKTGAAPRRRLFEGAELAQTIAAASEPLRTLFSFAACTGARESECLGLVWSDIDLADLDAASVTFAFQIDRKGKRQPLKTEESRRTIELPRSLAVLLAELKARSAHSQPGDFAFGTRSGRPISQRNALRGLRGAMKAATDEKGRPTFPVLSAVDERGRSMPVPRGSVPNFHGLRHTAASEAIRDGESAEEVSWQLGHKNSNVTRAVYVQEIKTAERSARRRAKMEARYGSLLEAATRREPKQKANGAGAEVVDLEAKRSQAK